MGRERRAGRAWGGGGGASMNSPETRTENLKQYRRSREEKVQVFSQHQSGGEVGSVGGGGEGVVVKSPQGRWGGGEGPGGGGASISSPKKELKAQTRQEEGAEGINSLSIKEGCGGVSLRVGRWGVGGGGIKSPQGRWGGGVVWWGGEVKYPQTHLLPSRVRSSKQPTDKLETYVE